MRIAFMAMSGTCAVNQEIHRLGLDMQGFAERWRAIASLPSLALLTLAGMTPKRHEVQYFEIEDAWALERLPEGFDLVAISSYTGQIFQAYEIARRYRELGVKTVIGGPHASVLPEEAAQHCDAVVVGPGELSWPDVLADCEAGRLQPMYGSLDVPYDFEDAPLPAYHLLDVSRYNRLPVQTSRGCTHRCEFCASSVLIYGGYHQKPMANVLAEIDTIRGLWARPFIEFTDDNSFVRRSYWRELLPELKKRRMRWFTEADISIARDEDMLQMMRESGCAQILVGLESPLKADLEGLDLKTDWKASQFGFYKDAVRIIQSHGITVNGCFVLGMDTQTPDVFDAVYDFVRETELFEVQITILTPFPGTPLYHRLKTEGRLLYDGAWDKCTLFDILYQPKRMSIQELTDGYHDLGVRIFCDEFTAWRRESFKKHWRRTMPLRGTRV